FGGPGKTSIRVGGGIYYTAIEDLTLFNEVGDAPFGLFWVSPSPVYLEEPYKRRVGQPDPAGNRFPFTIPAPGATGIWAKYLPIAFGTRPYSVTSGRELNKTTGIGSLDFQNNAWESTSANSTYNALQTRLEKNVGNLRLLAAYTWSKSIDNSSGFYDPINPFNPSLSRALSTFDVAHNFVVSYSYDLPFARAAHGVQGKLLSGWTISGITRFNTGFPVTLTEDDDNSLCGCSGADVPNYNGQPIHFLDPRKPGNLFFDPSPFSPEALGSVGNAKRRFFHGPGINNWDLAFHKNTRIS